MSSVESVAQLQHVSTVAWVACTLLLAVLLCCNHKRRHLPALQIHAEGGHQQSLLSAFMLLLICRQGRQCVFPEISRTYHFGRVGTHFGGNPNDTFFDKALARILISSEDVDWSRRNLTYLLKANYEVVMDAWLSNATKYDESLLGDLRDYCHRDKAADTNATSDLLITYPWNSNNHGGFAQVAEKLPGMMTDIRGQRPRASYNGIVMVRCRGRRLFLKPG